MKINIFLFDAKRDISKENKKILKKVVLKHAKIAAKKLNIDLINIVVYPNRGWIIPEIGSGGATLNSEYIRLVIDPFRKDKDVKHIVESFLPSIVYHEMNHISRWHKPGYGNNLVDVIISEGLAIVFAEEVWKSFKAPWGRYEQGKIKKYIELFTERNKKKDKNYNHAEWFFGKGKPDWLGYKIGAYIIRTIKKENQNIDSSALVHMNSKKIIKLSGLDIKI